MKIVNCIIISFLTVGSHVSSITTPPLPTENYKDYNNIDILFRGPCRNHRIEKSLYKEITNDLAKNLSGIIVRSDCNPIEIILWFKSTNDAFWVNPFVALQGLAEDIRGMSASEGLKTKVFDVLERSFSKQQLSPGAPTLPSPPPSCISQESGLTTKASCLR
ncbi:envelope glycoprotein L-like protein [Phocid alphaherpesvirus 1]|uniref:Envelope glycoprotein L-like protein n=1 Tax=Phocid alphaherpesvirus 1 TaxID=47418 RepID=A0A482F3H8_9ALPH|nr:envelope glycoprotein L-like protein [Phocid alphaherpesvirus 1]QBN85119.1 envelope glycoprotein L-like protein [Phocid alphaherpesvirus 1]UNP64283.1 envelope glycoprotein L-like protein [Phocid alphaherpesvirus 1]